MTNGVEKNLRLNATIFCWSMNLWYSLHIIESSKFFFFHFLSLSLSQPHSFHCLCVFLICLICDYFFKLQKNMYSSDSGRWMHCHICTLNGLCYLNSSYDFWFTKHKNSFNHTKCTRKNKNNHIVVFSQQKKKINNALVKAEKKRKAIWH